ncbi:uncharacterized protein LOC143079711 isoform X1 [Mytilus galloprovincialis]|uniref:uncharacterized protein LOC143079711 isoform X1 n=1 Tax=Mytilus galloprovincialis TaxID=29158 RepID=UPI003F7C6007
MQNCYNSGRIPRENGHDQNAKGQTESFNFIKELAEQNKLLKQRIEELEAEHANCPELRTYVEESKEKMKQIQEQHLKQMDEVNVMLAEQQKQETMKLVQEKLNMEQKYKEQIEKLKSQISQLETTNRELLFRIDSMAESEEQVHALKKEIEGLKKRIKELEEELKSIKAKEKTNIDHTEYLAEIEELKKKNSVLSHEVRAKTQKIIELDFRLDKMERELDENPDDADKISLIENLKIKITQMQAERSAGTERERYFEKLMKELQAEIEQLREGVSLCEVAKHRLYADYKKLLEEYNKLREKYVVDSQHKTFQDFVQLKRQLNHVKTENDDLKQVARSVSGSSLPALKSSENGVTKKRNSGSYKKQQLKTLKE